MAKRRKVHKTKPPFFLLPSLLFEPTYYTQEDTGNLQRPLWNSFCTFSKKELVRIICQRWESRYEGGHQDERGLWPELGSSEN